MVSVFDSNMVRNILRTNVFSALVLDSAVARIVLLVHPLKLKEYTAEFGSDKVIVEPYPSGLPSRGELITWFLMRHTIQTKNVRAKIDELYITGGGGRGARLVKYLSALCVFYASKLWFIKEIIRRLTIVAHNAHTFAGILESHAPDLVFLPTIFATNDIRLLKACVRRGIPTIGMVKSWDNLLGKDPLLLWPDRLVVHNHIVAGHAMRMHGYPESRIFVSGIPQMDVYADPAYPLSREELFASLGLDPRKRLIVYAAVGILISYHEVNVIRTIADIVAEHEVPDDVQLLVRLHPAYPSDEEKLQGMLLVVSRPGKVGAEHNPLRFDFEFHERETRELAATLAHADVIMQSGSTIAIDAACFDTPIISIGFDGDGFKEVWERSAKRLLEKDHFQAIIETSGTWTVFSHDELVEALNAYLTDPTRDREGRARIVSEQCYLLDGNAGKRIGEYILATLNETPR